MPSIANPEALVGHLPKSDGSATYSYAGYTVVGAVNGPIEVQRRDELPEEAAVDVIVRPAAGVGSTRERHLESLLQSALRQVILINNFPRTLIQVILQITNAPENEYVNAKVVQASSNLPMIPALMQTAVLSLLSAAIPLTATLSCTAVAILEADEQKRIPVNPTAREVETAQSIHVFGFTSHGDLILAESEGEFSMKDWDDAYQIASQKCSSEIRQDGIDTAMDDESTAGSGLRAFTRSAMETKTAADLYWK